MAAGPVVCDRRAQAPESWDRWRRAHRAPDTRTGEWRPGWTARRILLLTFRGGCQSPGRWRWRETAGKGISDVASGTGSGSLGGRVCCSGEVVPGGRRGLMRYLAADRVGELGGQRQQLHISLYQASRRGVRPSPEEQGEVELVRQYIFVAALPYISVVRSSACCPYRPRSVPTLLYSKRKNPRRRRCACRPPPTPMRCHSRVGG